MDDRRRRECTFSGALLVPRSSVCNLTFVELVGYHPYIRMVTFSHQTPGPAKPASSLVRLALPLHFYSIKPYLPPSISATPYLPPYQTPCKQRRTACKQRRDAVSTLVAGRLDWVWSEGRRHVPCEAFRIRTGSRRRCAQGRWASPHPQARRQTGIEGFFRTLWRRARAWPIPVRP
jgi:hypothetical protein